MKNFPKFALLVLGLAFCSGACSGGDSTDQDAGQDGQVITDRDCRPGELTCRCTEDNECDGHWECVDGTCVDCERGTEACTCYANGRCQAGLACGADGLCEACTRGSEGCFCADEGLCDEGLDCVEGFCVPESCRPGSADCVCAADGTCDFGLSCVGGLCVACSSDQVGCPCDGSTCSGGLVCEPESLTCRQPLSCAEIQCVEYQRCEDGQGTDARCLAECEAGFVWDALDEICQAVVANCQAQAPGSILADCQDRFMNCIEEGDSAACVGCLPGNLPMDPNAPTAGCRPAETCASLDCAGQDRFCQAEDWQNDAQCGACYFGYMEDAGACVLNPDANCDPTPADTDSIYLQCQGLFRLCEVQAGGGALCGDCIEPYVEDLATGLCMPPNECAAIDCAAQDRRCSDVPYARCTDCLPGFIEEFGACRPVVTQGELSCSAGEFAMPEGDHQDAYCLELPCADGDAYNEEDGCCVSSCPDGVFACPAQCNQPGQTGRIWPFTLANGRCICESVEGYFYDVGTLSQRFCDADGDGWLKLSVRAILQGDDQVLQANARCDLKQVDRFTLVNEQGQQMQVKSCDDPVQPYRALFDPACPSRLKPIGLFEVDYLDDQQDLESYGPEAYGQGARRLNASELNSLTKACSGEDDFNGNEIPDVREWAGASFPFTEQNKVDGLKPFMPFTYFLELHEGYFQAASDGTYGAYVIAERSRCDAEFPVAYHDAEAGDYWRSCTRRRASRYDAESGLPLIGLDFARFVCGEATGSCPLADVITGAAGPDGTPEHGLCQVSVPAEADWRGMLHHSQFACVLMTSAPPADPLQTPQQHSRDEFFDGADGDWQLNLCDATDSVSAGSGNMDLPAFACTPVLPSEVSGDQVGLAALRYQHVWDATDYEAGCINECASWLDICPDASAGLAGCGSQEDDFGLIECNHCPRTGEVCDTGEFGDCGPGHYQCNAQGEEICVRDAEPAADDDPLVEGDSNCDGVEGVAADSIFVATSGSDSNDGSLEHPVYSLNRALALADQQGKQTIMAAFGVYLVNEVTQLVDGISIYGGFSTTGCPVANGVHWCRAASSNSSFISRQNTGVVAAGLGAGQTETRIDRINFLAGNPTVEVGESSYGIKASNCGDKLHFTSCSFFSARAGSGSDGAGYPAGQTANGGGSGVMGGPGCEQAAAACGKCDQPQGGAGGEPGHCGARSGAAGGRGGHANRSGGQGFESVAGSVVVGSGQVAAASKPGTQAKQGLARPASGSWGAKGPDGADGDPGDEGAPVWSETGYVRGNGEHGTLGVGGGGGSGGGGGGGGEESCDSYGSAGGGGGGGGCGGRFGEGGGGGGSSIAAYLYNSAAVFENCSFTPNDAGDGGAGGRGQDGGPGGAGGHPELFVPNYCTTFAPLYEFDASDCAYYGSMYGGPGEQDDGSMGAVGGAGGEGGNGGHGGGGAGGSAGCVVLVNSSDVNQVLFSPQCDLSVSARGTGGDSPGNAGPDGEKFDYREVTQ